MNRFLTLLLATMLCMAGYSQTTIFDFEGMAPAFGDFNGSSTQVIDNPDNTGLNTSSKVAENTVPGGAAFAGTTITQDVDFANGKGFTMQVWSPVSNIPVLLKFEGADPKERQAMYTATGEWQELSFDFSSEGDLTFTGVTVFMNFNMVAADERIYYWDNLEQFDIVIPTEPLTAAPDPDEDEADVISMFSDVYTDVPVDTWLTPWSAAMLEDIEIEGNPTKLYTNLDFAGVETVGPNAIDLEAAEMTHLHVDVWSPNSTTFRIKLVDFGGDGPGGDNDTEAEVPFDNLPQSEWVSLDIPLSDFDMNQSDISQFIISSLPTGTSTVYLDNVYYYKGQIQMDLPVTFEDPAVLYNLIDFGGAESAIVTDPTDMNNTVAQTTKMAGAEIFAGTTLSENLGGTPNDPGFASNIPFATDASIISVRVWSPAAGVTVRLKAEASNNAGITVETETATTVAEEWETLEFEFKNNVDGTPALDFNAGYNKVSIFFDFGNMPADPATYYWDDVIFTGTTTPVDTEPMVAAPDPDEDPADVISMFSGVYTDVPVDTWLTPWSAAMLEDIEIEGNPTKLYTNLDFAGVETVGPNAIDLEAAEMTHLHVDVWTPNSTTFRIKLVDFGGDGPGGDNDSEAEVPFDNLPLAEWVSLDIPLADYDMNQSDISQFIISSLPTGTSTIYLDNVYYYKEEVLTGDQMDLPVTFEDPDVLYSLIDFAGAASEIVADPTDGSNTVAQTTKTVGAEGFAGTTLSENLGGTPNDPGFASNIPFTNEASIISVRVWSPNAGVPVRLKVESSVDAGVSVETQTNTTVAEEWETLEFEFKNNVNGTPALDFNAAYNKLTIFFDFGSMPMEAFTYYWDDVIFTGTTTPDDATPMVAAPDPDEDPANVISMFSDVYTDVPVDTWLTPWSAAMLEDIEIQGNPTKLYTNLDFAGVETLDPNTIDLEGAEMTHLHVDVWTPNSTTFRIKLVDFGGDGPGNDNDTEFEIPFEGIAQEEWVSLDIPLTDFMDMNQSDIAQFIISSLPTGTSTIYMDNVYYYRDVMDATQEVVPGILEAFPNPARDQFVITAPEQMQRLIVFSSTGQVVQDLIPNQKTFRLNVSNLESGFYTALAYSGNKLYTVKLIKE
jgi:hypothetical protein